MSHSHLRSQVERLREQLDARPEVINKAANEKKIKSLERRLREAQAVKRELINDMLPDEIKKAKAKLERAKQKLTDDKVMFNAQKMEAAASTKVFKQCSLANLKFVRNILHTDKHPGIDQNRFKDLTKAGAIMNDIISGIKKKK